MRRPSGCGALRRSTGSPPVTPGRTWPRPSSTGSRPPPAAARCSGSAPAAATSSGRSSRSDRDRGATAGERGGASLPRRPHQRRAPLRAQPDPQRGAAGPARDRARRRTRRSRRPRPSSPRRGRRWSGSPPRPLSESGADAAGAIGRDALGRDGPGDPPAGAAPAGGAGGRARRCRSAGRGPAEIWRLANEPGGRRGRAGRRGGGPRRARARPLHLRSPSAEPAEATLTVPGVCRFGSWEVRAELEAGVPAGRGPGPRRARPGRARAARSPCGPGARATGCARSASAAPSPSRTSSPTARCRARCGTRCRSSTSDGRIAWIAGVAVSEEFAAKPGAAGVGGPERAHRPAP